jgi:hypothetical protein
MPGLVPGIHVFTVVRQREHGWSGLLAKTRFALLPGHDEGNIMAALPDIPLPATIRSRYVDNINGLRMHVLEAGYETKGRPCLLLLHGFPELAYSWRKVMPALADAGYHVIAPDQRGYGRTTGWNADYDGDLASFRLPNLVRDALGLVSAFGKTLAGRPRAPRARSTAAAAKTLPMVLFDTRGQCRHAPRAAGRA